MGFYLPIFDRGSLVSQVRIQDSLFTQSVLAYQNQVLTAQQEVEDALSAVVGDKAQLASLLQGDEAALRSLSLSMTRYRSGETDYTTVSTAEASRLQTSDAVVQAEGSLLQSHISVYRAIGGGWSGVIEMPKRSAVQ